MNDGVLAYADGKMYRAVPATRTTPLPTRSFLLGNASSPPDKTSTGVATHVRSYTLAKAMCTNSGASRTVEVSILHLWRHALCSSRQRITVNHYCKVATGELFVSDARK